MEEWNIQNAVQPKHPQHHHDHASDDDVENDVICRRRGMSEDGAFPNSPTSSSTNSGNVLHHRVRHATDDVRSKSPLQHVRRAPTRVGVSPKKRSWGRTMRWIVLILVAGYLLLMISGYLWMRRHAHNSEPLTSRSSFLEPKGRLYALRERLEQKRLEERNEMAYQAANNASKRAHRTRPPRLVSGLDVLQYEVTEMETRKTAVVVSKSHSKAARMQDLCGAHAQNASLANPDSFSARHVLNSKSRVLITGILNPVGFHVALFLKEKCGVEVIAGIDPVFPNTVAHRLKLQKRIQLLCTNIPKLVQPILQPLVGLDPKKSNKVGISELSITGEIDLLQMKPTHIVHLASYSAEEYQDFGDENLRNMQSPYIQPGKTADMFAIRSSQVSMEQILLSMTLIDDDEKPPQFAYASTAGTHDDVLFNKIKLVDEILADTYSSLHGVYSTGLRLPNTIYGPWGRSGTPIHDLSKAAIEHLRSNSTLTFANQTKVPNDFVYIDDVVEGIIAAMQYREPERTSTLLDLSSDSQSNLASIGDFVSQLVHSKEQEISAPRVSRVEPTALALKTKSVLSWSPTTPLSIGLAKTLAWHLDDAFPYGDKIDQAVETGDEFRTRVGIDTCAPEDLLCHVGRKYLPCLSECSVKDQCTPSLFEGVAKLVLELTEGCDVVLYMQSLGYDVQDLKLSAVYKEEGEVMICNFAFVPETSRLVDAVIKKVPEEQVKQFGIKRKKTENADSESYLKRKAEGLNGRLLYKGWILVWVKDAHEPLATHDQVALKMSPGKLFAHDVKHALYVDESFALSPTHEDILFLVGMAHRAPLTDRNAYRKMENGKSLKYRLTAEPERRAAILMSPLKYKKFAENGELAKISVYEATKYMQVEIGENPEDHESNGLKKQREFYERVPTFINRLDLRSVNEAWYKYELKNWVRTRWIVHDMHLEEARQLRCDWYQEHVQWNNALDQLSFAHVMATREMERRISFQEPDDHIKPPWFEKPELLHLTDGHEWHALESEENGMAYEKLPPTTLTVAIADHMDDQKEEDGKLPKSQSRDVPLFIRVVSERVMMKARQAWAVTHYSEPKK
jgi:hypothetical protein